MILVCSCTPEPLPKPNPCKLPDCSDTIKYVWKRPDSLGPMKIMWYSIGHTSDTSYCAEWNYATEDGVIAVRPLATGSGKTYIRKLDKETGNEKWYWDGINTDAYSDIQYVPERNLMMVKQWSKNALINTSVGSPLFNTVIPQQYETSNPKGTVIGDYFYISSITQDRNSGKKHEFSKLLRTRIDDGKNWEEIYTINDYDKQGYGPNIYNVALWINPSSGDSILLLNVRLYHWERAAQGADPTTLERSDVVAYNLSRRKVEWTIDSICKVSEVGENFKLDGNIMYFNTGDRFLKIDLLNPKQILYSYDMFGGYAKIDKSNDRMFGLSLGISSVALSHKQVNWKYDNPGFAAKGLELFEGYIYTVNEHYNLMVFNAGTGKIVFQHFSVPMFVPQSVLGMMGRCSVDRKNRLLYCSDRYGVYCLKLPDKWE